MTRPRWLRHVLLTIAALSLAAIIAVFVSYRQMARDPGRLLEHIPPNADMHLQTIRQTATRNGIREWRLEADSATVVASDQKVLLIRPKVEFYMTDGDNVHLVAERGSISTDSSHMQVSGQVAADTRQYHFRTETLTYDPKTRQLLADKPVTIIGQSFNLRADGMAMNLESNITHFEGGVEGTLSEDLQL